MGSSGRGLDLELMLKGEEGEEKEGGEAKQEEQLGLRQKQLVEGREGVGRVGVGKGEAAGRGEISVEERVFSRGEVRVEH